MKLGTVLIREVTFLPRGEKTIETDMNQGKEVEPKEVFEHK